MSVGKKMMTRRRGKKEKRYKKDMHYKKKTYDEAHIGKE
jgi:hypothetical protein